MSKDAAKVILVGRVQSDVDARFTPDGKPLTKFRMTVTTGKKKPDEQYAPKDWYGVTVWGRFAEVLGETLSKGQQVTVFGRLATREYTDNNGKPRTSLDVTADDVLYDYVAKAETRVDEAVEDLSGLPF